MNCGNVYFITAPQVEVLEALLELQEEWGGQMIFKRLDGEGEPQVFDMDRINLIRGHFHGVDPGCNNTIDFHTHPMYVQQNSIRGIRMRNPLPSAPDMMAISTCHADFVPHIIITPIGNFLIEVTSTFTRIMNMRKKQVGEKENYNFYFSKFTELQELYFETKDTNEAIQRYTEDVARFGINVYYHPPHLDIRFEMTNTLPIRRRCARNLFQGKLDSVGVQAR